jgi:Domain of unknown function (DUF4136)
MKLYLLTLPVICFCVGCGTSYSVAINGYSTTGQAVQIPQAASISVVIDGNAPNPILEKEVGMKIEKLLTEKGYSVRHDKADYYLRFSYGIDSGRTITEAIPMQQPMFYGEYPFSDFYWYGSTTYVPYSEVIHTRWLILKLFEGQAYRASKKAKPLWIGEVTSAGTSSDLRDLLNYMLVAAFEHFAEDTRRQIFTVIRGDDERVLRLAEP